MAAGGAADSVLVLHRPRAPRLGAGRVQARRSLGISIASVVLRNGRNAKHPLTPREAIIREPFKVLYAAWQHGVLRHGSSPGRRIERLERIQVDKPIV